MKEHIKLYILKNGIGEGRLKTSAKGGGKNEIDAI